MSPAAGPCRVVAVEWDRGHEQLEGILRAEGPEGVVLTEMNDLVPDAGHCWLHADEVLSIDDLCPGCSATVRSATLHEARSDRVDPALTELAGLLRFLAEAQSTVAVYTRRTGSGELLAGVMASTDDASMSFAEIDTTGSLTGEKVTIDLSEIIRVDWDTHYLRALRALAELAPPADHDDDHG